MKYVVALLAFTKAASAACLPHEDTFMSCDIKDSTRSLQVCFTDLAVTYRFGMLGQPPELELTEPVATVAYEPWSGVGRSIAEGVEFKNANYSYRAYAGFERMFGDEEYEDVKHRFFGGVRVFRGGEELEELKCARETVEFVWGEGLFTAKNNLGYVWNMDIRGWLELPD